MTARTTVAGGTTVRGRAYTAKGSPDRAIHSAPSPNGSTNHTPERGTARGRGARMRSTRPAPPVGDFFLTPPR